MERIYINYGVNMIAMTRELMDAAEISKLLDSSMRVCVKPNLVVARKAEGGATTHPEIIEGIIQYLQGCEVKDIAITEGAWIGDSTKRAWDICGYSELARKYGVELIDTKSDRVIRKNTCGMELGLCESVLRADYLINVPVLKGHCQTKMTCCLKNLKGCIPDSEKRRYHTLGLHEPIAALSAAIRPDLHIVDSVCGDLSFEEGGNPIESNRIMLGFDPVLLDSFGAGLMGYVPDEIGYLRYARQYGVGKYAGANTEVIELNAEKRPKAHPPRSGEAKRFSALIDEDGACSACYAALIFALDKIGSRGLDGKLHIGQGFKGKTADGIGIGNCAKGFSKCVEGCPPKAVDIVNQLSNKKK